MSAWTSSLAVRGMSEHVVHLVGIDLAQFADECLTRLVIAIQQSPGG